MRRPGIYLADVSAGPAGYQRLVIDARTGQILERFAAPGRIWGPILAARGEEFGERPPPGVARTGAELGISGRAPAVKSAYGGPANVDIPPAISPYDSWEAPARMKPKPRSVSAARTKTPIVKPPLPPPAPRDGAKPDGSKSAAEKPAEADNIPAAAKPAAAACPPGRARTQR